LLDAIVPSPAMAILGETKIVNVEEYDIGSNATHDADGIHTSALGGTSHDAQDMHRMGKKQELRVGNPLFTL
jgi:choline transport protein